MSANIRKAIEELGVVDVSRWMLNDGQFLGVEDYDDHRIVGYYCTDSWLEFIAKDCVSVHYDYKAGYLWLRVNGDLNTYQRMAFSHLIEEGILNVRTLLVHVYDGTKATGEDLELDGEDAILYLTDRIAYEMEVKNARYSDEIDAW